MTEGRPDEATGTDERLRKLEDEYLARQTALTEVLKVIGGAAFDLESVLQAIVSSAASLCHAEFGTIYLREGDVYRVVTGVGEGANAVAYERDHPDRPGRHSVTGRVLLSGEAVQIEDVLADAEYDQPVAQELSGFRTLIGLPILRGGQIEGVIDLGRAEVRPFLDAEIALAATFADRFPSPSRTPVSSTRSSASEPSSPGSSRPRSRP